MSMDYFFEGLEHSSAFGFLLDEQGKFVPVKETCYQLYESDYYPFAEFADELRALNDYCFLIAQAVNQEKERANQELIQTRAKPEKEFPWLAPFTKTELLIGLEGESDQWEWVASISRAHLVILLYSFLKKTLKYLSEWFQEESILTQKKSKGEPKLYSYLYAILGIDKPKFYEQYREIAEILDASRKIRNQFAHENLEGDLPALPEELSIEKASHKLKLVELIDVVGKVLRLTEEVYEKEKS